MEKVVFEKTLSEDDFNNLVELIKNKKLKKILIKGSTGVGKSTLAKRIANELAISHIEMDKLYWSSVKGGKLNSNFDNQLKSELSKEFFVIEGLWKFLKNYREQEDFDLLIHLRLPSRVQLKQLILRDIKEYFLGKRKTFDTIYFLKNHF